MSDPFFDSYGDDFWRTNAQEAFNRQQTLIGTAIAKALGFPRRIIDVGAGNGSILAGAAPHVETVEAGDVVALESPVGVEAIRRLGVHRVPIEWYTPVDLRAWAVGKDARRFDMAICLEVAEHLPPECGPMLVGNLCRLADTVAFSAAYPGQGGAGHINERPGTYWAAQFRENGYELDVGLTAAATHMFRDKTAACWWYAKNLRIYRRSTGAERATAPVPRANGVLEAAEQAKAWLNAARAHVGAAHLNLMCANRPIPGWRNHDGQADLPGVTDAFWIDPWHPSLQSGGPKVPGLPDPYGWADDTFDYIYWNNGPEHVANTNGIIQELWRISKDGAKWLLITPGYRDPASWGDPTHYSHWSSRILDFYTENGADERHYPPALLEYRVNGDDDHGLDFYVTVRKPGKGADGRVKT